MLVVHAEGHVYAVETDGRAKEVKFESQLARVKHSHLVAYSSFAYLVGGEATDEAWLMALHMPYVLIRFLAERDIHLRITIIHFPQERRFIRHARSCVRGSHRGAVKVSASGRARTQVMAKRVTR